LAPLKRELSSIPNDFLTIPNEEEKNKRSMQSNNLTNLTSLTIYRQILYELKIGSAPERVKDRSLGKSLGNDKKEEQQTDLDVNSDIEHSNQNQQAEALNDSLGQDRSDEDSDWELCELCDRPVPPSQASEMNGDTYCSKCIKIVLKNLEGT